MKSKKSLIFTIEEIASLLRKEVKHQPTPLKKRTCASSSLANSVQQIAKLLRTELSTPPSKKKRSWRDMVV